MALIGDKNFIRTMWKMRNTQAENKLGYSWRQTWGEEIIFYHRYLVRLWSMPYFENKVPQSNYLYRQYCFLCLLHALP